MKFRFSYIVLIIMLLSLFVNGMDLTHHLHNSWLYNQMIEKLDFLGTDPYFQSQITYAYGVPAYLLSGLLWSIFSIHTVDILMGIFLVIEYVLLIKWFKNDDTWIWALMLVNLFFTTWDSYVAAFSNCLFWIASYAYFNKKNWWSIPLLIAAFNHPFTFASSLFFAVHSPALLVPLSAVMTYFVIAGKLFTSNIFLPIYTIFVLVIRVIINLLPIMVLSSKGKIKLNDMKILETLSKVKLKLPALLLILILVGSTELFLAIYALTYQPPKSMIDITMFEGIPLVNGTVRAVDYISLPSVYILPSYNFTLEAGSFRENNPQHMIKITWANASDYLHFLEGNNISYVLFCKMCNPQSNEREMLNSFNLTWENDYYYLYKIK
ncbi:Uncharacterised protein [Candidatus Tiddalikarchaeum anstoanum]|nr:Uncharacterised protein [Candidatus Tiddalikarchaeum anstoanum]